ncbi:D-Ala-D-Ala carboxypeptidase family metallohydrolase [Marinicauda pacifica]|jgi:hypothetical protein|uniref:D-Ala-D-Ala carboxypeptidase family metallohydrolase n=1 Tax=Marinicauda pacifica TaxID=1133559 RepID=UPI0035C7D79D
MLKFVRSFALCLLVPVIPPAFADAPAPRLAPRAPLPATSVASIPFDAEKSGFTLTLRGMVPVDFKIFTVFARPGEHVAVEADRPVSWTENGQSSIARPNHDWIAPQTPGLTQVDLRTEGGQSMRLNLIVMEQAVGEAVGTYRLGSYPSEPYRGDPAYLPPTHFAGVSDALSGLQISPHFTLSQFLCKQEADGEPYLVLSERLLAKLELLLVEANARGWRADTFTVMSGYRTPAYNAAIGNGPYSRHIYGGAADIFIDHDGDGWMDDLNGDGLHDRQDAAALFDLVESVSETPNFAPFIGGVGEYGPNAVHGPFVHVDERGWRARWGRSQS